MSSTLLLSEGQAAHAVKRSSRGRECQSGLHNGGGEARSAVGVQLGFSVPHAVAGSPFNLVVALELCVVVSNAPEEAVAAMRGPCFKVSAGDVETNVLGDCSVQLKEGCKLTLNILSRSSSRDRGDRGRELGVCLVEERCRTVIAALSGNR